jgi:hypothetical protein
MGREINVGAEDRLELRDAADVNQTALAILQAAFEERQGQEDGEAVMLDAVVEIAAEVGYSGSVDQAGNILKVGGRFVVKPSPSGRLTVRRAGG